MHPDDPKQPDTDVDLTDALLALRHALEQAFHDGVDSPIRFRVDQVDLTIQASVTKARKEDGGIKWRILSLGTERSRQQEGVQTLNLRLTPVITDEEGMPLPDDEQFISGFTSDSD